MALQPVSGALINRTSPINFNGVRNSNRRNNEDSVQVYTPSGHSGMKAVPVAVLIALSPLNATEAAAQTNSTQVNGKEIVYKPKRPTPNEDINYVDVKVFDRGEFGKIYVAQVNLDRNSKDFEELEYVKMDSEGKIEKRGLIRRVIFEEGDWDGHIAGIPLSRTDLDSYKPASLRYTSDGGGVLMESIPKSVAKYLVECLQGNKNNAAIHLNYRDKVGYGIQQAARDAKAYEIRYRLP